MARDMALSDHVRARNGMQAGRGGPVPTTAIKLIGNGKPEVLHMEDLGMTCRMLCAISSGE